MSDTGSSVRDPRFLKWLIIMGLIEGTSTLVLVWAVLMKRVFVQPWGGTAVSISGSIHGLLFIGFVLMLLIGWRRIPISFGMLFAGLVGAVLPLVVFIVDIPLYRMLAASKNGRS